MKEGDPCYAVAENLVKLSPAIIQKTELVNSECGYLAKETSKLSIKGAAWFFLAAYGKM